MWTQDKIAQVACFQVLATQEDILPIDPINTIIRRGWKLYTYKYLASLINCPITDLLSISNDAFSFFDPDEKTYIIAYNENLYANRVRFSLAHEIGHIILKHFSESSAVVLSFNEDYFHIPANELSDLEHDADIFAANFLAPAPLLEVCSLSEQEISDIFQISLKSATYRKHSIMTDTYNIHSGIKQILKNKFGPAIKAACFKNYKVKNNRA